MKSFFKEFGKFLNRGNALELAIGVVIGASFTAIVNAIVDGLFKPLLELIPGQDGLSVLKVVLRKGTETSDPHYLINYIFLDGDEFVKAVFIVPAFAVQLEEFGIQFWIPCVTESVSDWDLHSLLQ